MIKAIFFDFDGVILESVNIKTEAFVELFKDYPEHVDKIREHHINNTGVSRFEKIKYYFNDIIREPLSKRKYNKYLIKFSKIVLKKVIEADYVPGAEKFLKNNYRKYDLYVISATPTDEIKLIIEKKTLSKYFKEVFGSPIKKEEWIKKIILNNYYDKDQVVYVGDALSDYEAAVENRIHFIGRVSNINKNIFKGLSVNYLLKDLTKLDETILVL